MGATYDAFGSERYVLTFDNRALRDVAAFAPYEFVEILTNGRTYGGGGIFGLYSTVAADSLWSPYVFVHEFGHHFAGLADEYYTSDVAYEPARELRRALGAERHRATRPATAQVEGPGRRRARRCPRPGRRRSSRSTRGDPEAPPEIRAENRPEEEMDALFLEQQTAETKLLGAEKYAGKVGAFEGANYEAKGYFRPQVDCIMFTRDEVPFCAVCQRAIERVIDLYTRCPLNALTWLDHHGRAFYPPQAPSSVSCCSWRRRWGCSCSPGSWPCARRVSGSRSSGRSPAG